MTIPAMSLPTIHLNGSSPATLFDGACEALAAMRAAIRAVSATAPNGRDYYPQGATAFTDACREHTDRVARLYSVLTELEALAEHLADEAES